MKPASGARLAGAGAAPAAGSVAPPAGSATSTAPPQRVAPPAEPFDRVKVFGGLILCLAVCAIPLTFALGDGDVVTDREARVLLTSRETWQRFDKEPSLDRLLIPAMASQQAIDPPPMTVWLHIAAWTGLDPATADAQELMLRARFVSVAMALLALLATYWAGVSIGGAKEGRLATLAMGTTLLFLYEVRLARPDAALLGFSALSIAAGLWAMRPLKDINWVGRRVLGWLLAGAALAAAILASGPAALGFVLPPLIATIVLTPMRRVSNTTGLLFAVVLGLIIAAPWYLYVIDAVPGAQRQLFGDLGVPSDLFVITWAHFKLLMLLSPWVIWLIGALCQPFMRADRVRRRQLLIAWFWFVLVFVALSIPAAQSPRYLLPLMPAVGLMIGQLWAYHAALASQRQLDPGVNLLRVPHWLCIGVASIVGPLFIATQPMLIERGYMTEPELPGIDWPIAAAIGCTLLLIALLGARWHFKWRPRLAAYATTAWMVVASCVGFYSHARSSHMVYEHRADAQRVARAAAASPLGQLVTTQRPDPLDEPFVYYVGRFPLSVGPDQLAGPDADDSADAPAYLIAPTDPASGQLLTAAGFRPLFDFADAPSTRRRLYHRPPTARPSPPTSTAP